MLKKKPTEYQLNEAGKLSRAAWVMADCASTAKLLSDWTFFMDIAINQCNRALALMQKKTSFTVEDVYSSTDLWTIPYFKAANDKYMELINENT